MVYRARGQLGVGGVGGLSDLRGGKRTSLRRFTMIEGTRPWTRAHLVKEPPGSVRTRHRACAWGDGGSVKTASGHSTLL